jgi:hypothetical protein
MKRDLALIPWPQKLRYTSGWFPLNGPLTIHPAQAALVPAAEYLKKELAALANIRAAITDSRASVMLTLDPALAAGNKEHYMLEVTPENVTITGPDARAVFRGATTFLQLCLTAGDEGVPGLAIDDSAALHYRGYHLDLRVQQLTVAYFREFIDNLALLKYNLLVVEWEDKVPYERHPLISAPGCYTHDQLKELIAYARARYIEVVPQLQCLGHATYILKHDLYADLRETPNDVDQMCPQNKNTLKLFRELAAELVKLHPETRLFHIGGDEAWSLGRCPACKAVADREGQGGLYAAYIKQVCETVEKLGRTPILWGDIILTHPEHLGQVPRNAIINDWDYYSVADEPQAVEPGRAEWMSTGLGHADQLAERGFRVLASPAVRACPDGLYNIDYRLHAENVRAFCGKAVEKKFTGVLLTSWAHAGGCDTVFAEWHRPSVTAAYPTTPRLPVELTWFLVALGAEYAWQADRPPLKTVVERFGSLWHGLDPQAANRLLQTQYLSGRRVGSGEEARKNIQKIYSAIEIAKNLQPRRRKDTFKHVLFSLQLARHWHNQLILFHEADKKLAGNARERAVALQKMLAALRREAQQLKRVNSLLLAELYMPEEIVYDNWKRFDAVIAKLDRYVELIRQN